MVAVPGIGVSGAVIAIPPAPSRRPAPTRLVAIAVSPMELLRPESELARLVAGGVTDLLVASEDGSTGPRITSYFDYPDYDDEDEDDESTEPDRRGLDEVQAAVDRLDLPGLRLHRLGLRAPLGPDSEADLVAAMSELVGFDPEPGVYCLAPVPAPAEPSRAAVVRAAQRIAQIYGLPLLRYRCLELSVVPDSA
ncbi:hypothetical protein [Pseudonocardia asaccharolytica]|uniref:Uncharacterized protein n=1 Tax=Pseudonocardia asaccharolytica DSM 44247 = NBRC 16224 TaxID=1123024 RepID=A0A511D1N3_9PSEU|nr:hypothetical protein [Pseudonocardia asaccharolytica]GEL18702.1 hypothetical protein PA7_25390 [Pseudonocardia asaccharolytica DSM 44247 = NBRC 16224]